MITCGCDVGSRSCKIVILDDDKIIGSAIIPASDDSVETSEQALRAALKSSGIKKEDLACTVGTGFGKPDIPFAQNMVAEMSCHAKGAHFLNPKVRTLIDIGGMDCKVMKLNDKGTVENFAQNEKCASGTGLFLEDIAGVLEMKVEDMGETSKQKTDDIKITNQCSVFALSEVISLVALKITVPNIVAGIHAGVANRIVSMVHRVGLEEEFMLSGGVSKNSGVVSEIEEKLSIRLSVSDVDHQLIGALGAAVLARNVK
jgi:predicted CoA-substrate-specific enzyme activase